MSAELIKRDETALVGVKWFHNEAPSMCWGSPARVKEWIAQGRREREKQQTEQSMGII